MSINEILQENYTRSQNEEILFKSWQSTSNENKQMKAKIAQLENQIKSEGEEKIKSLEQALLRANQEIEDLRGLIQNLQPRANYSPANSDEEENLVAQETEWILPKSKKRKASSPLKNIQQVSKNVERVPTAAQNKSENSLPKIKKPPPVVVSNITDIKKLKTTMEKNELKNYRAGLINNNQIKINVDNDLEYRNLTRALKKDEYEWHTYEHKQHRPLRVMARNLHPSCDPEDIKSELTERGFKIKDVVNKIKKVRNGDQVNRTKLPLFMLTFDNSQNIEKVFNLKSIQNMAIKIEALRTNKQIPQCKNCQRYGHTKTFCQHLAVCVKCAGKHGSSACERSKNMPPKCYNCGEAHPANYRGCIVAKELQKNRNKSEKKQNETRPRVLPAKKTSPEITFAQAASTKQPVQIQTQKEEPSMMQMMQNMMNKIDDLSQRLLRIEARETGAIPRTTLNNEQR